MKKLVAVFALALFATGARLAPTPNISGTWFGEFYAAGAGNNQNILLDSMVIVQTGSRFVGTISGTLWNPNSGVPTGGGVITDSIVNGVIVGNTVVFDFKPTNFVGIGYNLMAARHTGTIGDGMSGTSVWVQSNNPMSGTWSAIQR